MGCGSRTFFIQSKGCGPGNMHIKSGGINNCTTATLSSSQTFDSNSEIVADGDMVIERDVMITCENCKIQAIGKVLVMGTIACTSSLCNVALEGNEIEVKPSGNIRGADIVLRAQNIIAKGIISSSGQGYAEESGPGAGNTPTYSGGSSHYATSGSGGGHGGDGAATCWNFRSTSESPTGMTVYRRGIDLYQDYVRPPASYTCCRS